MLATGTRHYVRNLTLILPVSLLAFVPAFVVIAVSVDEAFGFDFGRVKVEFRYRGLTSLICGVWLQAGLSTVVVRVGSGEGRLIAPSRGLVFVSPSVAEQRVPFEVLA